MINGFSYF